MRDRSLRISLTISGTIRAWFPNYTSEITVKCAIGTIRANLAKDIDVANTSSSALFDKVFCFDLYDLC